MKVLVLGASGMLGRAVVRRLAVELEIEVWACYHGDAPPDRPVVGHTLVRLNLRDHHDVFRALAYANPHVVVNCAGLVPQREGFGEPTAAIEMNALLPHRLAVGCHDIIARLIHISTDCVFSGHVDPDGAGVPYPEADAPDPVDTYGRTKLLGEVAGPNQLTLRMSLFGRGKQGLLEWFLAQPEGSTIPGYTNALFSGISTGVAADLIARIITGHPDLHGLWHAAHPQGISKYDLLHYFRAYHDVAILPTPEPRCDRRLDGRALSARLGGWVPPSYDQMTKNCLGGGSLG